MRPCKRLRQLYANVKRNMEALNKNASMLEEEINFQGFGDRKPELMITTSPEEWYVKIYYDGVFYPIEDIIEAQEHFIEITPSIMAKIVVND